MVVRIVVMYFQETTEEYFLSLFKEHEAAISSFRGCSYLRLLKNAETPNCYTTWSHWESLQSLEAYRKSQLFNGLWVRVKPLFSKSPKAFSLQKMD